MAKKTLYKVYRPDRVTQKQRVLDGDFEGLSGDNFALYWTGSGLGTLGIPGEIQRNRLEAYPNQATGSAINFDISNNARVALASIATSGGGKGNPVIYSSFTAVVSWEKEVWNTLPFTYFIEAQAGWYLRTEAGNLKAGVFLAGAFRTCQVALSTISAGKHTLAIGSDGRYIRLFVDDTEVATYDHGSTVGVADSGSTIYLGAQSNGTNPSSGTVDFFGFYDALLTAAQVQTIHRTKNPRSTNLKFWYDFDEGNGSVLSSYPTNYGGSLVAGINGLPTWTTSDVKLSKSVYVRTSPSSGSQQGIKQATGYEAKITGGQIYTAHAFIKTTAGETVILKLTPTGGGTAQSVSVIATGDWQQIVNTYTAHANATNLNVELLLDNANLSEKLLFIDKIALNDGQTAFDYFDQDTQGAGSTVYDFDYTNNVHTRTSTVYEYKRTWSNEVITDFEMQQEINTAGGIVKLALARPTDKSGEHDDVDFGNEVRIYIIDDQAINGKLMFTGYIGNYVSDEDNQKIDIELFGYGAELDAYSVLCGANRVGLNPIDYNSLSAVSNFGSVFTYIFTPEKNITLKEFWLKVSGNNQTLPKMKIYRGDPTLNSGTVISSRLSYNISSANIFVAESTNTPTVNNTAATRVKWEFNNVKLYAKTQYYIEIENYVSVFSIYGSGSAESGFASSAYPPFKKLHYFLANTNNVGVSFIHNTNFSTLYAEIWDSSGSSTAIFNSVDPSIMLRTILADYQKQGGSLTFDEQSIPLTNTLSSYPFRSVTVLDALKKCLELAPADWYFYIDQANKKVFFKQKAQTPHHRFEQGVHFSKLSFEKRTENLVNTVLFTGGELTEGMNLFLKFTDAGSVDLYGQKQMRYSDNRVTLADTAEIIATAIIERNKFPEIRVTFDVLDTFDIDGINPGDVVTFRGYGQGADFASTWDVGLWDQAYWDFDISNPSTLELQIARFNYGLDKASMMLSTTPPDVNKRIEDIKRNLEAQQTVNNPDNVG